MSVKMKETLISKRVLKCMYMGFLLSNDDNKYSESDILSISMNAMLQMVKLKEMQELELFVKLLLFMKVNLFH